MPNILDNVALSASGAFTAASYRQRPTLQETWERGGHEAIETLDCDHSDSNDFLRNILGTVWWNRARGSGVSRVIPRDYSYRLGTYDITLPDVTSSITPVSVTTDYKPIAYHRPWYAYKAELVGMDGVPIQWQTASSDVDAGDMRLIGESAQTLTANQIAGTDPVLDGREVYNIHYKPQRFMVLTDTVQNAIWSANADTANTELHRYVIRDFRFSARNLTMPSNYLYWAADLNTTTGQSIDGSTLIPIMEGAVKLFPTINVLMTWVDVPYYPIVAIKNCLGKVNAITPTSVANPSGHWDYIPTLDGTNWTLRAFQGYPPGQLLFDGVHDLVEHTNAAGQWVIDITYSFIFRPENKWNYFFNFKTNTFARAVTKDSLGKAQANWVDLYSSANFNSLFQLPLV